MRLSFFHFPPMARTTPQEPPLLILHGLFGSKQNWSSLGKRLSATTGRDVYALDQRNHGTSPHSSEHSLHSLAEDVRGFMRDHSFPKVSLIGHSMGGKVAMALALDSPSLLERLVVVDMAPIDYHRSSSGGSSTELFRSYCRAMSEVDSAGVTSASQADKLLAKTIPELSIRQFLLTNLKKLDSKDDPHAKPKMVFRINLKVLEASLGNLWGFPYSKESVQPNNVESLFIAGSQANYVRQQDHPIIRQFFPRASIEYLDAGHWYGVLTL